MYTNAPPTYRSPLQSNYSQAGATDSSLLLFDLIIIIVKGLQARASFIIIRVEA
jgi:hypothetical protein